VVNKATGQLKKGYRYGKDGRIIKAKKSKPKTRKAKVVKKKVAVKRKLKKRKPVKRKVVRRKKKKGTQLGLF